MSNEFSSLQKDSSKALELAVVLFVRRQYAEIKELKATIESLRAQLAQQEPAQDEPVAVLTMFDMRSQTGTVDLQGGWEELRVGDSLFTHPQASKPMTERKIAEALKRHGLTLVKTSTGYDVMKLGECVAHNIMGKQ